MSRNYVPRNWRYGTCPFCGEDWFEVENTTDCPSSRYIGSVLECRNCGARFLVCVIREPR